MRDFFATVRNRHSIRKYQADMPVEKEKLHAILEMACAAPSAGDLQAYHIIVSQKQSVRDALSTAAQQQNFISEAPLCLVFCTDSERSEKQFGQRGRELYAIQDATIAASYTQLAAVAAGLGSTWVGYFDEEKVRDILNIPNTLQPVALISVGYPAELPEQTTRRPLEDVISFHDE
jgi:nitroreductase